MSRESLGSALYALLACAGVQLLFDVGYASLRGDPGPIGYLVLVAGLTGGLALLVALAASAVSRSVEVGLALWVAIEVLAGFGFSFSGVALALALGVSTVFALRFGAPSPAAAGLLVATACVALVFGSRGEGPILPWLSAGLSCLAVLWGLAFASRWRRAAAPALGAFALASGVVAVALLFPRPDLSVFTNRQAVSPGTLPNQLVLILDTVRADHLSVYGYERETTPELERLVTGGGATLFRNAYATSNWTIPSHLSLFTGLIPSEHQGHSANGLNRQLRRWSIDLPETLAERLSNAGYRTGGVVANPSLMTVEGMGNGFHLWMQAPVARALRFVGERLRNRLFPLHHRRQRIPVASARVVNEHVLALLSSCVDGGCFVLANYMEAHAPYLPGARFAGRFGDPDPRTVPEELSVLDRGERVERAAAAYDEAILELDAALGALFGELEQRGLLDAMWIFVTSDHGEAFQEHRSVHHSSNLYNESVRVPLIVKPPRGAFLPRRDVAVGLLDLAATLAAIGSGRSFGAGRDLRAAELREVGVPMEFFGWSGARSWGAYAELPTRAVVRGDRKLIELNGRRELYRLDLDPKEQYDRAAEQPESVAALAALLPPLEVRGDRVQGQGAHVDASTEAALRLLGYVE